MITTEKRILLVLSLSFCCLGALLIKAQETPSPAKSSGTQPAPRNSTPRTLENPRAPGLDREENRPFKTYESKTAITHGPFILDVSDTSANIEWVTDSPSKGTVLYGENSLDHELIPQDNGLVPVGTLHKVELDGLKPGTRYMYKVVSTRVVRLNAYWPDMGQATESPVYQFKTFDPSAQSVSFSVITDTHESVPRIDTLMAMPEAKSSEFLVHDGDAFNWVVDQDQIFENFLDPISRALDHSRSLLYVRGNHDYRGPFARKLGDYLLPPDTGRFYYARNVGPVHLISIDTGEDKPDSTTVYSGLNNIAAYRAEELAWFRKHVDTDPTVSAAPFRIIVMHQPYWGWLDGKNKEWTDVANKAKVDLAIVGHWHRFAHFQIGAGGNNFPVLVIGQDQIAYVQVSTTRIHVTVKQADGAVVDTFDVPKRSD